MKLLVTGCAGFIGANFTKFVLKNYPNDSVVGVDALTYAANLDALKELKSEERFLFYKADICDETAMNKIIDAEKPRVVVNFAAESHVDNSILNPESFIRTNVLGTQVLLNASYRYGVSRFHQVSTDEVYGDVPLESEHIFDECSVLKPSSPYSASKAAADLIALSYMRTYGLSVSVSRSTNNYGMYQHGEKLIPTVIKKAMSGIPIPIYGDGKNMRDWLFVEDNCAAIDLIIRKGACEIYNIGSGNLISNCDLIDRILDCLDIPSARKKFVKDRLGHDMKYAVDCKKIRELGWKAEADFESGLKTTVEWYKTKYCSRI